MSVIYTINGKTNRVSKNVLGSPVPFIPGPGASGHIASVGTEHVA